ncbi:MAG: hypothetical protein PHO85_06925 [Candidatus Cloacimonetes bacterium]|nr:hypothetical protein [Candidatus Cloacimonadota bacterium]MDD2506774.1 hypothetical protein [Candidatus Cloacimonadota bacterium]MDD4148234.1 hypothetical protein [Candidatus Cloacimonadota bacterium]MDD4560250.1 hypothetical protein [Candidatus Cloacimonadota bacterium]
MIYLAIDDKGGGFDAEESLNIRIAKARALLSVFKLEECQDLAFRLNQELRIASSSDMQFLNLLALTQAHKLSGNIHSAANYAEEALVASEKCEDKMMKILAECVKLSYLVPDAEELESKAAIFFFQKSSQALLASQVKMPQLLFEIYNNLAKALNQLKMQEQALHYQLLAEKLLQDNGDMELKVNLNANIALSQILLQRWDDAYHRLREAERFYRQHHLLEPLIKVTDTLAFYYQKRQDYLRAYVMMRRLNDLKTKQIKELQQSCSI